MSTRERLQKVRTALGTKRVQSYVQFRSKMGQLESIRKSVDEGDLEDALHDCAAAVPELVSHLTDRAAMATHFRSAKAAAAMLETITEDPDLQEVARAIGRANQDIGKVDGALNAAFKKRVDEAFPAYRQLGKFLQNFANTRAIGLSLEQAAKDGLRTGKFDFAAPSGLAAFRPCLDRCTGIVDKAAGEGVDWSFLQKLMTGNATLADITEERRHWLADAGALGMLKLSL